MAPDGKQRDSNECSNSSEEIIHQSTQQFVAPSLSLHSLKSSQRLKSLNSINSLYQLHEISSSMTSLNSTDSEAEQQQNSTGVTSTSRTNTYFWNEDDFETMDYLGNGSSGSVYLVRHAPTARLYARKTIFIASSRILGSCLSDDMEQKQSKDPIALIKRELKILQKINNSSKWIVACYGAIVSPELTELSILMEFMNLGSLDKLMKVRFATVQAIATTETLKEEFIGILLVHVLEGLSYLYSAHGIIHRDVKPSNILISSTVSSQEEEESKGSTTTCCNYAIKLCDFGISSSSATFTGSSSSSAMVTSYVGTSHYMAPERIKGEPYGHSADSWSLGLLLLEMILGKFPFEMKELQEMPALSPSSLSVFEILHLIVNEKPIQLPVDLLRNYSCELIDLIYTCLEKDPLKRPTPTSLLKHGYVDFVKNNFCKRFDFVSYWNSLIGTMATRIN